MEFSASGFLRPSLRDEEQPDRQLLEFCPGAKQVGPARGQPDHPLWGPVLRSWRGWAVDPDIRHKGASGGVLSALLIHLLETGQIDAVLHCGADPRNPTETISMISQDRADILKNAGSRYAPSATLSRLDDLVRAGKRFAVVGKPCDVDAIARMRAGNARLQERIPFLLSFFCAGVPSQKATDDLVRALGFDSRTLSDFRYRGHGWPGAATAIGNDGTERDMPYEKSWGHYLSPHLQTRCKLCADGIGMAADIVCADAWVLNANGGPSFKEADGISAVLARSDAGCDLIEQATRADVIHTEALGLDELTSMQPGQVRRRRAVRARIGGVRVALRPVPVFENFPDPNPRGWRNLLTGLRIGAGAFFRVALGRL